MDIIMFGHKRIPSREGGVEVVTEQLAVRMAEKGHRVTCLNRGGYSAGKKEYCGVTLCSMPTIPVKGLSAVSSSLFAAFYCVCHKADVVHIHAEGPAFWCWLPKLFGKKVIVTIHGLDWARKKWNRGFATRYIRWGEQMAVRFADEIIVLSRNMQEYFLKTYGRNTSFLPNGTERVQPAEAKEITEAFGLKKDGYFLFLGRLVPEKGLGCLLKAFRKVETEKKLLIAGGASDSSAYVRELKRLAKGDDRVVFAGFVQGQKLRELYSNAYLYVLPSDLEGMPIGLLEAMSYGNCCVVSDIPECVEVVENKAVLFRQGDAEALREQLQKLCCDEQLVRFYRQQSREQVASKHDWDRITEQMLELYQR